MAQTGKLQKVPFYSDPGSPEEVDDPGKTLEERRKPGTLHEPPPERKRNGEPRGRDVRVGRKSGYTMSDTDVRVNSTQGPRVALGMLRCGADPGVAEASNL